MQYIYTVFSYNVHTYSMLHTHRGKKILVIELIYRDFASWEQHTKGFGTKMLKKVK